MSENIKCPICGHSLDVSISNEPEIFDCPNNECGITFIGCSEEGTKLPGGCSENGKID